MRTGSGRSVAAIFVSASSMRSSSLPVTLGAPPVRMSLPPLASTSEARNDTPCSSLAASTLSGKTIRRVVADQDFTGARLVLERGQPAPRRADGQQLQMRRSDRKEVEGSRMHSLRHLQRDFRIRKLDTADVIEHATHENAGATRALGVLVAMKPEQQRIAAEFREPAAVLIGDGENRLEAAADHIGDLLRAFAA